MPISKRRPSDLVRTLPCRVSRSSLSSAAASVASKGRRGIARMVDEDRACVDVPQQITAAQAALDEAALLLVEDHVRWFSRRRAARSERLAELMAVIARLVRS